MPSVFLGYVHPGDVSDDFMQSVLGLVARGGMPIAVLGKKRGASMVADGRNSLVRQFLETDFDYLLMTDTDISFEPEVVDKLIAADKPVVSALYFGHDTGGDQFVVGNKYADGKYKRVELSVARAKRPVAVDGVGMGCCLIKREVLEDLGVGPLWPFAVTLQEDQPTGEDVTFTIRAKDAGYDAYILPTARVGHRKSVLV